MTTSEIEYSGISGPTLDAMPDRHGRPVSRGDLVRVTHDDGEQFVGEVEALRPREAHEEGNVSKRLGVLDRVYSHFSVATPGRGTPLVLDMLETMNFAGRTERSAMLRKVELIEETRAERLRRRVREQRALVNNIQEARERLGARERREEARLDELRDELARLESTGGG